MNNDRWLYEQFGREEIIPVAVEETLSRCREAIGQQPKKGTIMQRKQHSKTLKTALLIAAAVCLLAGAALAVISHADFYNAAYGDGVPGRDAETVEKTDADGNVISSYTLPAVERVAADEEEAESLIGSYVATVGQSVEPGGCTITISDCVLDENGIGAVTVDIDDPNGIEEFITGPHGEQIAKVSCVFSWDEAGSPENGAFPYFDDRSLIDESVSSDTHCRYVYYLVAGYSAAADIKVSLTVHTGEWTAAESEGELAEPAAEEAMLTVPATSLVQCRSLSCEGLSASLSPVGLVLRFEQAGDYPEIVPQELVIRFDDGSEYIVLSEELYNTPVSLWRSENSLGYAFNRLVDTDSVKEIYLLADGILDAGSEALEYTLIP